MRKKEDEESPRNKQLGLKVREEFYWKVKELALKKRCCIVKVIEDSVELLQNTNTHKPKERDSNEKLERKVKKYEPTVTI